VTVTSVASEWVKEKAVLLEFCWTDAVVAFVNAESSEQSVPAHVVVEESVLPRRLGLKHVGAE
jgi:hypothetical protein